MKCFNDRIGESVFKEVNSLDELIEKMSKTTSGQMISDVTSFKYRYGAFKRMLSKDYPQLTNEEILLLDKHFHDLRNIYEWVGSEYFFAMMEYELKQKNLSIKEDFLNEVASCDINEDDITEIIEKLPNCYAKGYLAACCSFIENSHPANSEEYRQKILECANWNIWNN